VLFLNNLSSHLVPTLS